MLQDEAVYCDQPQSHQTVKDKGKGDLERLANIRPSPWRAKQLARATGCNDKSQARTYSTGCK
jgi:hypothetical protein